MYTRLCLQRHNTCLHVSCYNTATLNKRAKMALYCSIEYQICFESNGLLVQEVKIYYQNGGRGSHLGCPIGTILVILYLKVTPILHSKFWVNWPFRSEEVQNRFSRWQLWRPSWISDWNDFSYFLSTSHPDTSYQVSSQLTFRFRRSSKQIFKMAAISGHLGFLIGTILAIFYLKVAPIIPRSF